jgi:hypothetical protein
VSVIAITASSAWSGGALDYGNQQAATISASSEWEGDSLGYADGRGGASRAFPLTLLTHEGTYVPRCAQAITLAPASFVSQVQDRGGRAWRIALAWDGLDQVLGAILAEFLEFAGRAGAVFSLSLDRFCPGVDPAPGDRVFRATLVDPGWSGAGGVRYSGRLEALELPGGLVAQADVIRATSGGWEGGGLEYYLPEQFNIFPGSKRWEGANDSAA